MKKILIIGATSTIATACSRLWATEAAQLFLVARDKEKLSQTEQDLSVRGATSVESYVLDLNNIEQHTRMLDTAIQTLIDIDIVLIAHGTLPDQQACEQDVTLTLKEITNNALNVIALLTLLANTMAAQKRGTLAVISSVAGDRGRPSNYVYGAAKSAVTTFCAGLRARLFKCGVHVITIKPGFVETPMTQGLPLPTLLVAKPEQVAKNILKAIHDRKNTLYTPWFWWGIMKIICAIPEFVFKKLKI